MLAEPEHECIAHENEEEGGSTSTCQCNPKEASIISDKDYFISVFYPMFRSFMLEEDGISHESKGLFADQLLRLAKCTKPSETAILSEIQSFRSLMKQGEEWLNGEPGEPATIEPIISGAQLFQNLMNQVKQLMDGEGPASRKKLVKACQKIPVHLQRSISPSVDLFIEKKRCPAAIRESQMQEDLLGIIPTFWQDFEILQYLLHALYQTFAWLHMEDKCASSFHHALVPSFKLYFDVLRVYHKDFCCMYTYIGWWWNVLLFWRQW